MLKTSNIVLFLFLIVFGTSCKKSTPQFTYITTNPHERWKIDTFPVMPSAHEGIPLIEVDVDATEQTIDGFGACFNELGWDALHLLPDSAMDVVIGDFFSPEGCNFTLCRVPVGANDYARNWYSLDETASDFGMKNFTIERDRQTLIPYIKEAMIYNSGLRIWGSPWSPPAWMKTNGHYACRPGEVNDLKPGDAGREGMTQFIMEKPYLEAYALYLEKFVKAYRNEGIHVVALHVQNEPNSCQNFPSCVWTASDQARFVGEYLGPRFRKGNVDAEIWYGTYERPSVANIDTIMQSGAAKYIAGIGFQWAGKDAIAGVHEKYPGMKLMQTESECGNGSNDWKAAEHTWSLVKHYLENGANAYMYWNMVLDQTGKSRWGWKQNSLVTVDSVSHTYRYNPEYYLFKHLTNPVKPGAVKLRSPEGYDDMMVFKNPGGEIAGILVNNKFESIVRQIRIGERYLVVRLRPKSFNSFIVR